MKILKVFFGFIISINPNRFRIGKLKQSMSGTLSPIPTEFAPSTWNPRISFVCFVDKH